MKTLGSVESITGGLFASTIVSTPGASKFYKGSVITYTNEIKELLGIDTSNGVVNAKVALEMARAGREYLNVDLCVAFTGNAGPEILDGKKVGKVFIAINEDVFEKDFLGDRNSIRKKCVSFALSKLKGYQ